MRMTIAEAEARADLILAIKAVRRASDEATQALVAAITERDSDNKFLRACGIQPIEEVK